MAPRIVSRFSCGAASAVATKLALRKYGHDRVEITYCDPGSEHPDNKRFLADCERWFGKPVVVLRSTRYADTWDVWTKERFIASRAGSPCTGALKREPWFAFERPDDILVMGYTAEERSRVASLRKQNFERVIETPLIDASLTKADCLALIERAGIRLPAMYLLGFRNNNCIGCPKGGRGYWNMIRRHFPNDFSRMIMLQRELGVAFWVEPDGTEVYLDQLDPNRGVLSGMVVLSGYRSPLYDHALINWRRVETPAYADGANPRIEVLWMNDACADAFQQECAQASLF